MNTPGSYYEHSGKFDLKSVIISTLAGIVLCIGIGALYALIAFHNPLIYLNFLLLAGAVLVTVMAVGLVRSFGHIRNPVVSFIIAVLLCYTTWAAHWSLYGSVIERYGHISFFASIYNPGAIMEIISRRCSGTTLSVGRLGSSGIPFDGGALMLLYLIEFGAFMAPVFIVSKPDYYCEDCKTFHKETKVYIEDVDNFYILREKAGEEPDYRFLEELSMVKQVRPDPKEKKELIKVVLNVCEKCEESNILDLKTCTASLDKNSVTYTNGDELVARLYIKKAIAKSLLAK